MESCGPSPSSSSRRVSDTACTSGPPTKRKPEPVGGVLTSSSSGAPSSMTTPSARGACAPDLHLTSPPRCAACSSAILRASAATSPSVS
eukprot:7801175-Pyramimonas_sp.AAC.1